MKAMTLLDACSTAGDPFHCRLFVGVLQTAFTAKSQKWSEQEKIQHLFSADLGSLESSRPD